jgi:hypothetical protein
MTAKFLHNAIFYLGLVALSSSASAAESSEAGGMIAFKPLGAPIIENGRVSGQLRVVMKVVPQSEEDAVEIAGRAHAWQSKLLASLNEFARLNVSIYRPVDASKLKAALLNSLREGGAKAKDVLLIDVVAY